MKLSRESGCCKPRGELAPFQLIVARDAMTA